MAKKIFLIEDEEDILKTLERILIKEGFSVSLARDGLEALNKLQGESYNLIILDLMLPKWDGFKLCKAIKQDIRYKDTPVIVLTAMAQESDRQKCLSFGVEEYMKKPFDPDILLKRIRELTERKKNSD
jgi:DNA-binding response OmpR family regulator